MHDIRLIRDDPEAFDACLKRRGLESCSEQILNLDGNVRAAQTRRDGLLAVRNQFSKDIGKLMAVGDIQGANVLKEEVEELKADLPEAENIIRVTGDSLKIMLQQLPNLPAADVPEGTDEASLVDTLDSVSVHEEFIGDS